MPEGGVKVETPETAVCLQAAFPVAFEGLFRSARNKVYYGGRGSAKSRSFARALLTIAINRSIRVLCTRELQNSIKDSVHRLLQDEIERLGYTAFFDVTENEIRSHTGSLFIFKGLRYNTSAIRSLEGIDICWVEEAEKVSDDSWKALIPTIRNPGSEIWVSFNPDEETDPTYQRFVANPREDSIVVKVNYNDNPFFPIELRREMEFDRRVDPEGAAHVWDGMFRKRSKAAIFNGKWRVDVFEMPPNASGPYYGGDWGFSQDPTVLIKMFIVERKLYIEHEAYGVGVELDDTPTLFDKVPGARESKIIADSARPETISHVKNRGYSKIVGCAKWPGCVEDGITFLRSFEEIVIHERCKHVIQEAILYSYKLDKLTKEPTNDIVDKHNHCWDSVRYGLEKLIMASKNMGRPSIRTL